MEQNIPLKSNASLLSSVSPTANLSCVECAENTTKDKTNESFIFQLRMFLEQRNEKKWMDSDKIISEKDFLLMIGRNSTKVRQN